MRSGGKPCKDAMCRLCNHSNLIPMTDGKIKKLKEGSLKEPHQTVSYLRNSEMASAAAFLAARIAATGGNPDTTPFRVILFATLPPYSVHRGPLLECAQSTWTN